MPKPNPADISPSMRAAASRAPMLDPVTERDYLQRIQDDDDPEALGALIESHLRLVLSIATAYTRRGLRLDDLVSEGTLGLVEAARRFDLDKDARFSTYAAWWTRALIRRYASANRRIVRAPSTRNARMLWGKLRETERRLANELGEAPTREQIAAALDVSPDDVSMVDAALNGRDVSLTPREDQPAFQLVAESESPEEATAAKQRREMAERSVRCALRRLDEREKVIIERRHLQEEAETLASIGRRMGLSRERVRQLEQRACRKLRDALQLEQVA